MARTVLVLAATILVLVAAGPASAAWADPPTVTTMPAPTAAAPAPTPTTTPSPSPPASASQCSIFDNSTWGACVDDILTRLFRSIVVSALNPLLDLLGRALLSTPDPISLPRVGELWNSSWQIVLTCYATIVMIAGLLVMAHQTLQSRYSIREVLPRLAVGIVAGAASMAIATEAIAIANALSGAIMGEGLNTDTTAQALKNLYLGGLATQGIIEQLLGVVFAVGLIAVLITYIVRLAATVVLIAGAPIVLMGHALPQTEGIARWWWKAFGGVLAVQVAQSLTLITALRVVLAPGFTPLGLDKTGLVNLLIGVALVYVLVKIPSWLLGPLRGSGGGRSFVGGLARAYVMGRAFGMFRELNKPRTYTRKPVKDPAWPKPIRTWWGMDGQHSPAAMARRMRDWQGIERARRPRRIPPGQARFLQAIVQTPTHDIATTKASIAPAATTFHPPVPEPPTSATPARRPSVPPAAIRFRTAKPTPAPERWLPTTASLAPVRFRPAVAPSAPPPQYRTANSLSAPVFSEPTNATPPIQRRARSHAPAPVHFRPAAPPVQPTPAPPVRRRRGGERS